MIFMTKLPDKDIVLKKAAQLNKSIFTCLNKDHRKYMISASIGICFTDSVKSTYSQLYKNADSCIPPSKMAGISTVFTETSSKIPAFHEFLFLI